MNGRLQNCFTLLLALSFVLYLAAVAVGAGVSRLPWDLPDRNGQVFGFSDPMSFDHLRMSLARVTLLGMVKEAGIYGSALGIMHLVGLWLLRLPMVRQPFGCRLFFAAQSAVFPLGWLFSFAAPFTFSQKIDREFFTDGLDAWMWAQAPWVVLTATIAICWRSFPQSRTETARPPDSKPI